MKDTFWTDELVKEYASLYIKESWEQLGELKKNITSIEQFKSSKAPKKEWEVVAFGEHFDGRILQYKLQSSGLYRNEDDDCDIEYEAGQFIHDYEFIHSVRRLSDGEVFSLGDRLKDFSGCITSFEVKSVWSGGLGLRIDEGNADNILDAEKLPNPVLTTVDGAGIMEDQQFWVVGDDCQLSERIAGPASPKYIRDGDNIFSTREAAEDYVFNNRPLLSLNDVKNICQHSDQAKALAELTALVKQKLNP